MKFKNILTIWLSLITLSAHLYAQQTDSLTYDQLKDSINTIITYSDESERDSLIDNLLSYLKTNDRYPLIENERVAFFYKANANTVFWAGDFNSWNHQDHEYHGQRLSGTNYWILEKTFPLNARLDYKIVVDDNWYLDPNNPHQQLSGYGYNSELRMPEWQYPYETMFRQNIPHGSFGYSHIIHSTNLGYRSKCKVYLPANYTSMSGLPVIYVTDGHEYSNSEMGSMIEVLDNLIYEKKIPPIIAVFIDPRDPSNTANNRRGYEYTMQPKFADYIAEELVAHIDATFRTNPSPDARGILGTSLGGMNAAYFGAIHPETFHLIAIHSPAFFQDMFPLFENQEKLPLKIFMSTGVINDTEIPAREMNAIFEEKGYPLSYVEVNEGHSWGNWRALIDEPLIYLFSDLTTKINNTPIPQKYNLQLGTYPNPFNPNTTVWFQLETSGNVSLNIVNIAGATVDQIITNEYKNSGQYEYQLSMRNQPSGIYFIQLIYNTKTITHKILYIK